MLHFDREKLRDPGFRARFFEKLSSIREVQQQHTFVGYAKNRALFNELLSIYEENLVAYKECYQHPAEELKVLSAELNQQRGKIHPQHFALLLQLRHQISQLLENESYSENAKAISELNNLKHEMEQSSARMSQWKEELSEGRKALDNSRASMWDEDWRALDQEWKRIYTQLHGDILPEQTAVWDKTKLETAIEKREIEIKEAKKLAGKNTSFMKRLDELAGKPYTFLEFEGLLSEIKKHRRKRKLVIGGAGLGIVLLGIFGLLNGPGMIRAFQHKQAWEAAKAQNTYEAFFTFVKAHPNGMYTAAAKKEMLDFKEGRIPRYQNPAGVLLTYNGDLFNGHPHGKGKAQFINGDIYEGSWEKGLFEGQGVYSYADSASYDGLWSKGKREGKGSLKMKNGNIYKGLWKENLQEGEGTLEMTNGEKYSGAWKQGKMEGFGTYIYEDSAIYKGGWINGKRSGKGKYQFADGSWYEGNWKAGMREGEGVYVWDGWQVISWELEK